MIKNLKYRLAEFFSNRRVRYGGLAVFTAFTILAVTLYGHPIYTGKKLLFGISAHIDPINISDAFAANIAQDKKAVTPYPVYVTCGEMTVTVEFTGGTVADALALAGFTPDQNDFVYPSLATEISDTVYIDYVDIDYKEGSYTEPIKHTTTVIYSDKYTVGYDCVTTKGVDGLREVKFVEKLVNGVSAEKTIVETKVLSEPVEAIRVIGTKKSESSAVTTSSAVKCISVLTPKSEILLDKNGNPVKYKEKKVLRATAYTYTGQNCSTGVAPKPGYIAVNPNVIPYGTKMYIKSPDGKIIYGYAVAADTGGFIKNHPTGIDLFMETAGACTAFGVRNMEVYILE
ncbi:MAG: 3D domain-containing protein [Acutalibacteraceae bacterium]|jgi:3D (Asp-Asp-Asp) domain-containing protein